MTGPNPKIPKSTLAARKRLIEIYKDAQRQLSKSLTSATLTDFQEFRIREQLQQIDAIIASLNASVKKALPGVVESYYKYGADLGSAALKAQGVKVGALNLGNRIHTAAVQAVAEQMALDLAGANTSMKTEATRILRQTQQTLLEEFQINKEIARGVVEGETRRQTSARLRDQLKDRMKGEQFITIKGRNYTPEYYSELVTRTRTREAVTEGAKRRGLEYGITEFQVSIHDNPCPRCAAVQGKVYSVRDDSEFPKLTPDVTPPIHPHCFGPDTMVATAGLCAAFVAQYDGPMLGIRFDNGRYMDVTPGHPILTPQGFVRAGELKPGDLVMGAQGSNFTYKPIRDVAAKCSDAHTTALSWDAFHGDGRYIEGTIEVRHAEKSYNRHGLFDRLAQHLPPHDARFDNSRFSARGVREILADLRSQLCLWRVESVNECHWSGPVYDLETASGLYLAGGVMVSNCRHVLVAYIRRPGEKGDRQHKALVEASNADAPLAENSAGYEEALAKANEIGNVRKKRLPGEGNTAAPAVGGGLMSQPLPGKAKEAIELEKKWRSTTKDLDDNPTVDIGESFARSKKIEAIEQSRDTAYQELWDARSAGTLPKQNGTLPEALAETTNYRAKMSGVDKWVDDVYGASKEDVTAKIRKAVAESDIMMALDSSSLKTALKDGEIKNSLQTGKGTFQNITGEKRAIKERSIFGITASPKEPELYPKYGFLTNPGMQNVKVPLQGYGNTYIKFKRGNIADRTTITFGDSLNQNVTGIATPAPLNNPDYRLLSSHSRLSSNNEFTARIRDAVDIEGYSGGEYVEAQIFGKLGVNDIETVFVADAREIPALRRAFDDAGLNDVEIVGWKPTKDQAAAINKSAEIDRLVEKQIGPSAAKAPSKKELVEAQKAAQRGDSIRAERDAKIAEIESDGAGETKFGKQYRIGRISQEEYREQLLKWQQRRAERAKK